MSKLTREDKIKIYERRKNRETISSLAKFFNICESNINYLIVLINHESIRQVAIDISLISDGTLHSWLLKFQKTRYNVVEKKK